MTTTSTSAFGRLWSNVLSYVVKFGVVGVIGLVVDVGIFNLLRVDVLSTSLWFNTAIGAKVVSTVCAIIVNWIGNRYWTFRKDRHKHIVREFMEFVSASLAGMLVALACLWVSHHVLGYTSLVADNISGNIIGLGLGTLVRFVLYRFWVWRPKHNVEDGLT